MRLKIVMLTAFLIVSISTWSQSNFKYRAEYWADIKSKGFAAIDNPIREKVEVIKIGKSLKVILGLKVLQYVVIKETKFSTVRKDLQVKNGKDTSIISIAIMPNSRTAISIEKVWMIPDAKAVELERVIHKTVIITQKPKTVPAGKEWLFYSELKFKAQVDENVGYNGNRCNALFFSNPQFLDRICFSHNGTEKEFYIIFDEYEEVKLASDLTYEFNPVGFLNTAHSIEYYGFQEPMLIFNEGDEVWVGNCLQAVEVVEKDVVKKK